MDLAKNKKKLEEIVLVNEVLMDVAIKNLDYAVRYKKFIQEKLYEAKHMYKYRINLYKKAVLRNPGLALR